MTDRTHPTHSTYELFGALGNAIRMAIVLRLLERGEGLRQSELLQLDELANFHQSTVSGHLRQLTSQGLLVKEDGKRGAFSVAMPRTTATLVDSAAAIQQEYFEARAVSAAEMRRLLRKADMARLPGRAA